MAFPDEYMEEEHYEICPYCGKEAEWVENKEVYGRNYGKSYMMWLCRECDAFVGCHNNTKHPKGSLAKRELRELRKECHRLLDPQWKEVGRSRAETYAWLVKNTGVQHIGEADIDECKSVIEFLTNNT